MELPALRDTRARPALDEWFRSGSCPWPIYLLMATPSVFVAARVVRAGLFRRHQVTLWSYESNRLIRLGRAAARIARYLIENHLPLLLIAYAAIAAGVAFWLTPSHSALILIVTLFGAVGPPALWLVGNSSDGQAIRLLSDTMAVDEITPPAVAALDRVPPPTEAPAMEDQPKAGTDPVPEA